MARFNILLLLALFAVIFCSTSVVTPATAITTAEAADVDGDEAYTGGSMGGSGGDDEDEDDEDDVSVEDNEDDDYGADGDADEDNGEDEDAGDSSEPDKPAVLDPPGDEKATYTPPKAEGAIFFDGFQSGLSQWTHSNGADYNGRFATGQGAKPTLRGDRALIIPEKAHKYGLSAKVPGLDDLSDKDFVLQYELKLEEGVTCGGAYLKLPIPGFTPSELTGDTPYSIMFGPDKCGATDKVHFIFQSENPNNGERAEHHLKSPPTIANSYDKKTHLYTLIVRKDSTFELLVDNEKKSYGSLTDKFTPPLQPEEKIDDPEDKKPEDWVDEKQIPDPDAKKPDDWDEDAPKQIEDEEAVKPDGWLDDEPETVPDPDASKPDTWDDEEDGQWEAKSVPNPKCEAAGCGKWTKPMKDNPDYKGKWSAPMIDNPKYIGEWSPKKIDNPAYYKVEKPQLLGIGGVAFEIWTMDQGVLFDNLYIGTDPEAAERFANATFRVKQKTELEREEEERKKEEVEAKKKEKKSGKDRTSNTDKMGKTLGPVMDKIEDYVDKFEKLLEPLEVWLQKKGMEPYLDRLIDLGIKKPMIVVVLMPLTITLLMLALLGGSQKEEEEEASVATGTTDAEKKKTDAETQDEKPEDGDEGEEIIAKGEENGIESTGVRKRSTATKDS